MARTFTNISMNDTSGLDLWRHPASIGFRSLFYAVTPGESSFEKIEDVPDYISKVSFLYSK